MSDPAPLHAGSSQERFEALYVRYYWSLVGFCGAFLPDRAAAEDAAQEAFVRAYRYGHALDPARSPWPWLKAIAKNVMATRAGRESREVPVDPPEVAGGEHDDATADAMIIAQAMRAISPRHRAALQLRYEEGLAPETAARRMGLRMTAFNQLVFRARTRLRAELRRLGETVPALAPVGWLRGWARRLWGRTSRWQASRMGPEALMHAFGAMVLLLAAGMDPVAAPTDPQGHLGSTVIVAAVDDAPRDQRRAAVGSGQGGREDRRDLKSRGEDPGLVTIIASVAEDPDRKAKPGVQLAPLGALGVGVPGHVPGIRELCGQCPPLDPDQVPVSKKVGR